MCPILINSAWKTETIIQRNSSPQNLPTCYRPKMFWTHSEHFPRIITAPQFCHNLSNLPMNAHIKVFFPPDTFVWVSAY